MLTLPRMRPRLKIPSGPSRSISFRGKVIYGLAVFMVVILIRHLVHDPLDEVYPLVHPVIPACEAIPEGFPVIVRDRRVFRLSHRWHQFARDRAILRTLQPLVHMIPNDTVYCFALGDTSAGLEEWPVLSFSAERSEVKSGRVVLIPDAEALSGHGNVFGQVRSARAPPFSKRQSILHWRGSTTGAHYYSIDDFRKSPRVRLLDYLSAHPDVKQVSDVGFTHYVQFSSSKLQKIFEMRYPVASFAGIAQALKYRYLIDVDGNANAYSRLAWSLMSGSLVLKHRSEFMQWYYPDLLDGVHYLSISEDFSNLRERFDWAETHLAEAENITRNARAFASKVFSPQAVEGALISALRQAAQMSQMKAMSLPLID